MPSSPDQDRYSIDEMMDRLKSRPSEDSIDDGQLVTRSDGSQAIKVRKRKRRSRQPHKEERKKAQRARMVQVSAILILILAVIFAAGSAVVYSNSAPFRNKLETDIRDTTGAKVELQRFRMNPASANAGVLELAWPEGNALHSLYLRDLTARISPSSLLGKPLNGEELNAIAGKLILTPPQPNAPTRTSEQSENPRSLQFQRFAVASFDVLFGNSNSPLARLTGSEASFSPANSSGRPQLLLNGGTISLRGWPKFEVSRAHVEFRQPLVDIVSLRLADTSGSHGSFEIAGTVAPMSASDASTLAMKLDYYPLEKIAGQDLATFFSCRIETPSAAKSNFITVTPDGSSPPSMSMRFTNAPTSSFEVRNLPFLLILTTALQDTWFEAPSFESEVTGALRRSENEVSVTDLKLVNRDRMAISGSISIAKNKRLSGNLRVGVTKPMLASSGSRSLDTAFGPEHDGFRWIDITLGGTTNNPTDNFKQQLDAILSGSGSPDTPKPGQHGVPSFEELTLPE
ncbi:MAG: hypothetical protein ACQCXQ_13370 [Verrucomicrobiales bacterium]